MSRILSSIDGRSSGHDKDGKLISLKGFRSGAHGKQIDLPSVDRVVFFDDFLGDVIADQWNYVEGTDASPTAGATLSGGIGGVLQFSTGDAGTGLAADLAQVTMDYQWQASNGGLAMQARVKTDRITAFYAFIGFTDLSTLEAPVIAATGTTITTNATDAVGFLFDTGFTVDNWKLVGVATDVDATMQDSGVAPVADDYATYRVEITAEGVATFFINGAQVGTSMTGAVTAAADLTPTLAFGNLSGVDPALVDVDYVHVAMDRAVDGGAV